jgi:hypothetical protein
MGGNPGWVLNGQLRSDILNFDLDAFITAARSSYNERSYGQCQPPLASAELYIYGCLPLLEPP